MPDYGLIKRKRVVSLILYCELCITTWKKKHICKLQGWSWILNHQRLRNCRGSCLKTLFYKMLTVTYESYKNLGLNMMVFPPESVSGVIPKRQYGC
jgi:hypothetical protein